jgi:hypothetical protein
MVKRRRLFHRLYKVENIELYLNQSPRTKNRNKMPKYTQFKGEKKTVDDVVKTYLAKIKDYNE